MKHTAWLVQRAMLAIVLMISFYVLALGLAATLVWIPYEAWTHHVRIPIKLALVCIACAATIVWAVLPRIDRFVPPGPTVTPSSAPELFTVLTDVAAATKQAMPSEVYLVSDVNAFVAQRGGIMGLGSRRVMGLGLPLMQAVTVQEFRGIVAHEFGHYHSGDVKIGPWIYKTRAAIGRTIEQLGEGVLQTVFVAYGNLFLRVTHAVSRRQEFIADEVAAHTAGAGVMASALRKVHGAAVAFHGYWNGEVGPVLNSGYLPPLTAGFASFIATESVSARMQQAVRTEEAEGKSDPYDTHPALRERVAALQQLPQGSLGDTRPALSLLANPASWERRILGSAINDDWARSLKPVTWDKVIDAVYVPMWRGAVKENAIRLRQLTLSTLPFVGALASLTDGDALGEREQAVLKQIQITSLALCLVLYNTGWSAVTSPGQEIVLKREADEVRPYAELMGLAMGKVTAEQWRDRCVALRIEGLPLGSGIV
jgi:heat shock protein HtpX